MLQRARQEPVIVRDEADGEFAVLPLDEDVIDLLLERNPGSSRNVGRSRHRWIRDNT
jgi:hypothetical protein